MPPPPPLPDRVGPIEFGETVALARSGQRRHAAAIFAVTEAEAAAIRAVFEQQGELSAAIELRRLFPGVTDNAKRGRVPGPSPAGNR
jgi:hypothetical protein